VILEYTVALRWGFRACQLETELRLKFQVINRRIPIKGKMVFTFIRLQTMKFEQPLRTNIDLSKALVPKDTVV
jgi:hypothetical protein